MLTIIIILSILVYILSVALNYIMNRLVYEDTPEKVSWIHVYNTFMPFFNTLHLILVSLAIVGYSIYLFFTEKSISRSIFNL